MEGDAGTLHAHIVSRDSHRTWGTALPPRQCIRLLALMCMKKALWISVQRQAHWAILAPALPLHWEPFGLTFPQLSSVHPTVFPPYFGKYCTGCPTVDVSTLISHISLMPGPIIKPFHSMKVKTVRIFLVYDMSSYWLYYPILGMNMFLTRFSQKRKSAHQKCPHIIIFLCLELEQIRDHIYYTNSPHLYSKCGLRFAPTQSIKKFILCGHFSCALFISGRILSKTFAYLK